MVSIGGDEERIAARGRLSLGWWWASREHRIEGPLVRPVAGDRFSRTDEHSEKNSLRYWPMGRPELPAELAKLSDERDETLLAFVNRYGLLGQLEALLAEGPPRLPRPETPSRSSRAVARTLAATMIRDRRRFEQHLMAGVRGDSVAWIRAHAKTVALVLELSNALMARKDDALVAVMDKVIEGDLVVARFGAGSSFGTHSFSRAYLGRTYREQAQMLILKAINPNLGHVHPHLFIDVDHRRTEVGLAAPCLLGYVYRLLSEAVVGGQVRECGYDRCGRLFVATDERMKYCPPSLGMGGVSPCMNRSKVARKRKRDLDPKRWRRKGDAR